MRQWLRAPIRMVLARTVGRNRVQGFYELLHDIALRGMNYRSGDYRTSGELITLQRLAQAKAGRGSAIVFDVGANTGEYAAEVAQAFERAGTPAVIHAFEPAAASFAALCRIAGRYPSILPQRLGVGDQIETRELHYDVPCSPLGSFLQRDLRAYGRPLQLREPVDVTTLDAYCAIHAIDHIDFLKVDVEGYEYAVLVGAKRMIEAGRVDVIQFEFGEAAIDARHYLRDYFELLDGYDISRITRDGIRALGRYREEYEIFRTVNFLAERARPSPAQ